MFEQLGVLHIHYEQEFVLRVGLSRIVCELPSLLRPARLVNGEWVANTAQRQRVTIASDHGGLFLVWDTAAGWRIDYPLDDAGNPDLPSISLGDTMIGETQVVISASHVDLQLATELRDIELTIVVPIDTRPVLSFGHAMNDVAREPAGAQPAPAFACHPDGRRQTFDAGIMRFIPTLTTVRLYEHRKGEAWPDSLDDWKLVASSRADDLGGETAALPGVWLADADPEDPSRPPARRLQLWTNNPLLHAADVLGPGYSLLLGRQPAGTSYAENILGLYPDPHACEFTEPERVCVPFDTPVPTPVTPRQSWVYRGLRFTHDGLATFTDVVETGRPPRPRLDTPTLRQLHRDLAAIGPYFATPGSLLVRLGNFAIAEICYVTERAVRAAHGCSKSISQASSTPPPGAQI